MGMSNGNRQHGTPILIDNLGGTTAAHVLERLVLQPGPGSSESYGEAWVQALIHRFPEALPIEDIEPGLASAVSVCMEMPTAAGSVDNLLVTTRGDLVLVECKLWRNPEARREVVAQIMDYARSMASWSYEDLEAAIPRGITPDGGQPSGRLYDIVGGEQVSEEAAFVDAVARNLRLGRFLLLLVGDGIREGVEMLADYLQSHPGLRFTLGLVELAIHRMPSSSGFIVQPRVLARTVNLERAVIRIEGGEAAVSAPPSPTRPSGGGRRTSISEEHLFEGLAAVDPALPERLRNFLDQIAGYGVFYTLNGSLMLKFKNSRGNIFNLGCIYPNGEVYTRPVSWAGFDGHLDLAHRYLQRIATAINGTMSATANPAQRFLTADGKKWPSVAQLLDASEEWRAAIEEYTTHLAQATQD
jgi:hypothetical protein